MSATRSMTVILCGLLLTSPVVAQVPDSVLHHRVRITTSATADARHTGILTALDTEALQLDRDDGPRMAIALTDVRKVEIWKGNGRSAGIGAAVGLGIGAAAGVTGMLVFCHEFGGSNCGASEAAQSALIGGLAGGVGGAVLGGPIGAAIPHTKWEDVQVRPAIVRGAPGLALRLEF